MSAYIVGKFLAERNIGDEIASERVAHFLRRRDVGVGQDGVLEPDLFEHAKNIGAELDAGADFGEFLALLEKAHRLALAREGISRNQTADAAPRNEKGRGTTITTGHQENPVVPKFGTIERPR